VRDVGSDPHPLHAALARARRFGVRGKTATLELVREIARRFCIGERTDLDDKTTALRCALSLR